MKYKLSISDALIRGIQAQKNGNVDDARYYYSTILRAQRNHPEANHYMGALELSSQKIKHALPLLKAAVEAKPEAVQFWLTYIDALTKNNQINEAISTIRKAKKSGARSDRLDELEKNLIKSKTLPAQSAQQAATSQEPPTRETDNLLNLYKNGKLQKALQNAHELRQKFPNSLVLLNIIGASYKGLNQLNAAVEAYKKALEIMPNYAGGYNNMGATLRDQGNLDEAIEAYGSAIAIKPDYPEAYNNLGISFQDQVRLDEAIEAFSKALKIKPDFAEAYYNLGSALKDQGKIEQAIEAFTKALNINYKFVEAHWHITSLKTYKSKNEHFQQVKDLYNDNSLKESAKCNLSFALAKMYEDLDEIDKAFDYLSEGNSLRKKLLNYSIEQDRKFFNELKRAQPALLKNPINIIKDNDALIPIFILGMPRSGTTLVEQIISSHSKVTGAGELKYVPLYGEDLARGSIEPNKENINEFREKYLSNLAKLANRKSLVTDKLPHNFRFIPLICSALPEAKIIHVQRDPKATCWSNYKHYFVSTGLGYCYNLTDVVDYYKLYNNLMEFWESQYDKRIYKLDYEKLTTDQDNEIRQLIKHLGIDWEDACLSPQDNNRSIKTASQQQVRQKIYQRSSEAWRKYEPFLGGAFDTLTNDLNDLMD